MKITVNGITLTEYQRSQLRAVHFTRQFDYSVKVSVSAWRAMIDTLRKHSLIAYEPQFHLTAAGKAWLDADHARILGVEK